MSCGEKMASFARPLRIAFWATSLVAAVALGRFWIKSAMHRRLCKESRYRIAELVEIPEGDSALSAGVVERLLGLTQSVEYNLFAFDVHGAEKSLTAHPLIEKARIWRCPPNCLTVSYRLRAPVAQLAEWPNLALDKEGHIFPIRPYLTPKLLPKIALGLPSVSPAARILAEGKVRGKIAGDAMRLSLEILQSVWQSPSSEGARVARLDVSRAFDTDLGQRGLELVLEDPYFVDGKPVICRRVLRLTLESWRDQLTRYRRLLLHLAGEEMRAACALCAVAKGDQAPVLLETIDLRLAHLAYIDLNWKGT